MKKKGKNKFDKKVAKKLLESNDKVDKKMLKMHQIQAIEKRTDVQGYLGVDSGLLEIINLARKKSDGSPSTGLKKREH